MSASEIIITDLTRFGKPDKVCVAGVAEDGVVIRPMPYLSSKAVAKLDIHPGGVLEGEFKLTGAERPHVEDATYSKKLRFKGPCTGESFRRALASTMYSGICAGFDFEIVGGDKCIPSESPPPRSLITIQVAPDQLTIVQDSYKPEKMKAHIRDRDGLELGFVPITDRGFHDYAQKHVADYGSYARINEFIHQQDELYLRLGLGREWKVGSRNGYWIQLNGIYTFPEYLDEVRCYDNGKQQS